MHKPNKKKESKELKGEANKVVKHTVDKQNHEILPLTSCDETSITTNQPTNQPTNLAINSPTNLTINSPQNLIVVSKIDGKNDAKEDPSLTHPSYVNLKSKSINICPPALRERGYEINEEIGGGAFSKGRL